MGGTTIATVVLSMALSMICSAVMTNVLCKRHLDVVDKFVDESTKMLTDTIKSLVTYFTRK